MLVPSLSAGAPGLGDRTEMAALQEEESAPHICSPMTVGSQVTRGGPQGSISWNQATRAETVSRPQP